MNRRQEVDVLIIGGGVAGLWILNVLCDAGYRVVLVEKSALGHGQTMWSQGIVHSGAKYGLAAQALPALTRSLQAMPARWRASLQGEVFPDLRAVSLRSRSLLAWVPRTESVRNTGHATSIPLTAGHALPSGAWPGLLRADASEVRVLDEFVLDMGSLVSSLYQPHRAHVLRASQVHLRLDDGVVAVGDATFRPRAIVLAAGSGNGTLLQQAGVPATKMQTRPLSMLMLRGPLPEIYGHCVVGGDPHITVTSARLEDGSVVWQVGGRLAETTRWADDPVAFRSSAVATIRQALPSLDLRGVEVSTYHAVRAEPVTVDGRRPAGAHVELVADHPLVMAVWPTKFALTPQLADDVLACMRSVMPESTHPALPAQPLSKVAVAQPPWKEAEWFPVD